MQLSAQNGFAALLLLILAAVMVGDGSILAWLAIVPFLFAIVSYSAAVYYSKRGK